MFVDEDDDYSWIHALRYGLVRSLKVQETESPYRNLIPNTTQQHLQELDETEVPWVGEEKAELSELRFNS